MKTILPLNIKAYEFKDLSQEAKNKVLSKQIQFWIDAREYNPRHKGNFEKAIDEAERMKTPWFIAEYIYDYCQNQLIKEIKDNDYLFDEEGNMLPLFYHMKNDTIERVIYKVGCDETLVSLEKYKAK